MMFPPGMSKLIDHEPVWSTEDSCHVFTYYATHTYVSERVFLSGRTNWSLRFFKLDLYVKLIR